LTRKELVAVMPGAAGIADRVVPALDAAMQRFDIASPARSAAFLAQLAHESGQLQHWTENLNYGWQGLLKTFPKYFKSEAEARQFERKPERIANRVYADRMDNGNEASGDGWRYRGRGPIQLTGKDNYRTCGVGIGVDLVNEPERLETPEVGCLAAAWFWASKGLNALADAGDFVTITRRINGALKGLEERTAFWTRAKAVFGVAPAVATPRARRGMAGKATLERAEKPVKPRATGVGKAGAKAEKVPVAPAKKARTKVATPRVTAAKKAGTKAAKPRVAAAKKVVTKAAKPRAATTRKSVSKPAATSAAAAKKAGTKTPKPRSAAAKNAKTKSAKSRAAAATKPLTKARKPRATVAKKKATGRSRATSAKKAAKKAAKPRSGAVKRRRAK